MSSFRCERCHFLPRYFPLFTKFRSKYNSYSCNAILRTKLLIQHFCTFLIYFAPLAPLSISVVCFHLKDIIRYIRICDSSEKMTLSTFAAAKQQLFLEGRWYFRLDFFDTECCAYCRWWSLCSIKNQSLDKLMNSFKHHTSGLADAAA